MQNLLSRLLFLLVLFSFQNIKAQDVNVLEDLKFVSERIEIKHTSIRPYIYNKENNPLVKYNPFSLFLGGLLFVYQNSISYQFSADCIYNPSCSEFSKRALKEYGILKACFLSADRLTRCNRISATGIHYMRIDEKTHRCSDSIKLYSVKHYLRGVSK